MHHLAISLLILTNAARIATGLPAMHETAYLDQHAQARATYLCDTGTFSHAGWRSSKFWDLGHMRYSWQGENLSQGFIATSTGAFVPGAIQTAFMNSPEHKANILDAHYSSVGFGSACNIVVEEFAGNL